MKSADVRKRLREAVTAGAVRYVQHALDQMAERGFLFADVERLLRNGFHDPGHDAEVRGKWRYRIQGKTMDGVDIKVAVEIEDQVVVVTVID